jgi:hypothetical protein
VRFFASLAGTVLLGALYGAGELLRQFPAAARAPLLLVPFARPVVALSFEVAALVALSVALGGGVSVRASRAGLAAAATLLIAVAAALALAMSLPRANERPGRVASDLLSSARSSCNTGARVSVPLIGLEIDCSAEPPLIRGAMPGTPGVKVSMRELEFADDLRQLRAEQLSLEAESTLKLKLSASSATIRGMSAISRPPSLSPVQRFALLLATAGALLLGCALVEPAASASSRSRPSAAPRRSRSRAAVLLVLEAVPGCVCGYALVALDRAALPGTFYALLVPLALAGVVACRLLARRATPR